MPATLEASLDILLHGKRFLKVRGGAAEIDTKAIEDDARFDGRHILRTTTSLPSDEVAIAYEQLCWIERLWRDLEDVMEVRPIFHHLKEDNVRGHIFACFLALYLAAELKRRLKAARLQLPGDDVIRDLSALRAIEANVGAEGHLMRSPLRGCVGKVLAPSACRRRRQRSRSARRRSPASGHAPPATPAAKAFDRPRQ